MEIDRHFDARNHKSPERAQIRELLVSAQQRIAYREKALRPSVAQDVIAERLGVSLPTLKRWTYDECMPYWALRALDDL